MHHGGEGGEEDRDKLARVTAVVGVHQMNSHQLHRSGLMCMGYVGSLVPRLSPRANEPLFRTASDGKLGRPGNEASMWVWCTFHISVFHYFLIIS